MKRKEGRRPKNVPELSHPPPELRGDSAMAALQRGSKKKKEARNNTIFSQRERFLEQREIFSFSPPPPFFALFALFFSAVSREREELESCSDVRIPAKGGLLSSLLSHTRFFLLSLYPLPFARFPLLPIAKCTLLASLFLFSQLPFPSSQILLLLRFFQNHRRRKRGKNASNCLEMPKGGANSALLQRCPPTILPAGEERELCFASSLISRSAAGRSPTSKFSSTSSSFLSLSGESSATHQGRLVPPQQQPGPTRHRRRRNGRGASQI